MLLSKKESQSYKKLSLIERYATSDGAWTMEGGSDKVGSDLDSEVLLPTASKVCAARTWQ